MKNILIFGILVMLAFSCKSQKTTAAETDSQSVRKEQRKGKGKPSIDEIFKMDTNGDGKISMSEAKGPLQKNFSTIDTNEDGFLSRSEVENAPRPERGQRQPRN